MKWTAKKTIKQRNRLKTMDGIINRMYWDASRRCKDKNHPITGKIYGGLTICSKEEFKAAAITSKRFMMLYEAWSKSGFKRALRPTPDRINGKVGYVPTNMTFTAHNENKRNRWNGIIQEVCNQIDDHFGKDYAYKNPKLVEAAFRKLLEAGVL